MFGMSTNYALILWLGL